MLIFFPFKWSGFTKWLVTKTGRILLSRRNLSFKSWPLLIRMAEIFLMDIGPWKSPFPVKWLTIFFKYLPGLTGLSAEHEQPEKCFETSEPRSEIMFLHLPTPNDDWDRALKTRLFGKPCEANEYWSNCVNAQNHLSICYFDMPFTKFSPFEAN